MKENNPDSDALSHIAWHPAFVEALNLELKEYLDILEFHPEYQLTMEPLRIDCVVIKKAKGVTIEKNIAAIFRGTNLLEYKSPGDYVSVRNFYKVYGYACLYASLNEIPVTDITVSFVENHYPRELVRHLESERGYAVEKTHPGIYTVSGDIFPMQIVDIQRLSENENLWLKGLSNRLGIPTAKKIIDEANLRGKGAKMGAYLAAIFEANAIALQEAMKMGATVTFESVLEEAGLIAKWEARGKAIGEASGEARGKAIGEAQGEARGEAKVLDIARNLLEMGLSLEAVVSATKLDAEKVKGLYAQQ
ncbi:MAG: hypothetical protein FWD88_04130 [Treponema sp.]|nr:hypothetical protein [Treponema sp.]